jgi:beta-glucosidase
MGGDMIEVTENGEKKLVKENRSYFGKTGIITNERHLDLLLNTASATEKVIVALDVSNPMIFGEFESEVDAILVGFGGNRSASLPDKAFLEIISGQVEPSGLLPIQMPANMETVEKQFEDVPRDMECFVDNEGNAYDFAFGLNWSGVIQDDRTAKYNVTPIVGEPPS